MEKTANPESTRKENSIIIILFLGVLMGSLDIAVIAPAYTRIEQAFDITARSLVWIFTIYILFNLVGTPFMARLSDMLGRRSIYMLSVGIFGLGSLIVALSWNFPMVVIGRAFQGFGSGGIFPIASAIIGDTFPEKRKGRALGYLGAVLGVAFILGPIIGGLLLTVNWHLIFLINIPVAIYVIKRSSKLLPSNPIIKGSHSFDWIGMILLAVLLTSFAWGLNRIDTNNIHESITKPSIWIFLIISLILFPIFILIELKKKTPVIPISLFHIPRVTLGMIIAIGAGALTASLIFVPALAVAAFHVSTFIASIMMVPAVITASISSLIIGRLVDSLGPRKILITGIILVIISCIVLGFTAATWAGFFICTIVFGIGFPALVGAPLRYIMLDAAPVEQRSSAQGMTSTVVSVGQLLGSAFLGALISSQGGGIHGYSTVFINLGIGSVVLIICAFLLKDKY